MAEAGEAPEDTIPMPERGMDTVATSQSVVGDVREQPITLGIQEKVKLSSLAARAPMADLADPVRRTRAQKRLRKRYMKHQRSSAWMALPTISESEEQWGPRCSSQIPGSVPADRGSFFGEATVSLPRSLATFSMATFLATPQVRKDADDSDYSDDKSSGEEEGSKTAAAIAEVPGGAKESMGDPGGPEQGEQASKDTDTSAQRKGAGRGQQGAGAHSPERPAERKDDADRRCKSPRIAEAPLEEHAQPLNPKQEVESKQLPMLQPISEPKTEFKAEPRLVNKELKRKPKEEPKLEPQLEPEMGSTTEPREEAKMDSRKASRPPRDPAAVPEGTFSQVVRGHWLERIGASRDEASASAAAPPPLGKFPPMRRPTPHPQRPQPASSPTDDSPIARLQKLAQDAARDGSPQQAARQVGRDAPVTQHATSPAGNLRHADRTAQRSPESPTASWTWGTSQPPAEKRGRAGREEGVFPRDVAKHEGHGEEEQPHRRKRTVGSGWSGGMVAEGGREDGGGGVDPYRAHPMDSAQDLDVRAWRKEGEQPPNVERAERERRGASGKLHPPVSRHEPRSSAGRSFFKVPSAIPPIRTAARGQEGRLQERSLLSEDFAWGRQGHMEREMEVERAAERWQARKQRKSQELQRHAALHSNDSILDSGEMFRVRSIGMDTAQEDLTFATVIEPRVQKTTWQPEVYAAEALCSDPGGYYTEAAQAQSEDLQSNTNIFATSYDLADRPSEVEAHSPRPYESSHLQNHSKAEQPKGNLAAISATLPHSRRHSSRNARLEGLGSCIFPNGDMYEGQFKNGVPHGYGCLKRPGNDFYAGSFVKGERSGAGVCHFDRGDCFEGSFAKDLPCGLGTLTSPDGAVFQGDIRRGMLHGFGVRFFLNGVRSAGMWEGGHLAWSRLISNQARLLAMPINDIQGVEEAIKAATAARSQTATAAEARVEAERAVLELQRMRASHRLRQRAMIYSG